MKNRLWFTLNSQGYCVRYDRNYLTSDSCSGYLIEPLKRVDFASLIKRIADESIHSDFYD